MRDGFGREITYLRVSITDRCNLRCRYCTPVEKFRLLPHDDILSYEEITDVVREAAALGVTKVRITGGEPLVRRGAVDLVAALARLDGIADLCMTTNGTLLAEYAADLAGAGLHRVNVSLDATDPGRYRELTGGGEVADVLRGIDAALAAGLDPVKLNCVLGGPCLQSDRQSVLAYGRERGVEVRTIRLMDLESGRFSVVEGGSGGDCPRCDRLRLTSDGRIRPCLFSDTAFRVRELGSAEALRRAVRAKPERGGACERDWMHGIGG